jgi:acetyltransferase
MAQYPAHLVYNHTLYDGRRVQVRPVRRDDGALFTRFLADLSPESRYSRFQKWIDVVPDRLVVYLTDIDYDQHMAFVCVARSGSVDAIVGDARYRVDAAGTKCDFGIIVADSWHKSGVAGILMHVLVRAARERGLTSMESQVLRTNFEMLRFARALGFTARPFPGDNTLVWIVKDLARNNSASAEQTAQGSSGNAMLAPRGAKDLPRPG